MIDEGDFRGEALGFARVPTILQIRLRESRQTNQIADDFQEPDSAAPKN